LAHDDFARAMTTSRPNAVAGVVVPVLTDPVRRVTLRAHQEADLPAIVELANDPGMQHWTTVPIPDGGYGLSDARDFALNICPAGWAAGTPLGWAIEAEVAGHRRFCGSIDLRLAAGSAGLDSRVADVGFGLHPAARGLSIMSSALRMVRDYGLDVLGLSVVRWRARVGNWDSRRVAAAAGFVFDGTVRKLLLHRGELLDGWLATITADDPRTSLAWQDAPELHGEMVTLRPFTDDDLDDIVGACTDPRSHHWLASLPSPYTKADARAYLLASRELTAQGHGFNWCVADAAGRCRGSISLEGFGGYARRVEIGYWAHPEARGRGMTTDAVRTVTRYAEQGGLCDSILIRCAAPNAASRQVAERAGYHQIGVLPSAEPLGDGSIVDLVLYSRP
jgi:RimJ/RimL family protein N-acetyltransferase